MGELDLYTERRDDAGLVFFIWPMLDVVFKANNRATPVSAAFCPETFLVVSHDKNSNVWFQIKTNGNKK